MSPIQIQMIAYLDAAPAIHAVREAVFHQEQGIDLALDFDGHDPVCQHILVYSDAESMDQSVSASPSASQEAASVGMVQPVSHAQPIGTARIRFLTPQLAKIERVAVLADYRGQGIGLQIMQTALEALDRQNVAESKVHAQIQAAAFYLKLGFKPCGEVFDEAGLPHQEMRRSHPNPSPGG